MSQPATSMARMITKFGRLLAATIAIIGITLLGAGTATASMYDVDVAATVPPDIDVNVGVGSDGHIAREDGILRGVLGILGG